MDIGRKAYKSPIIIDELGWKYNHMGIPIKEFRPDEKYLPKLKFLVSGFDKSPLSIEWMRFELESPIHLLIQAVPYLTFKVENLTNDLQKHNFKVLTLPNSPGSGICFAMLKQNGSPVDLIELKISNNHHLS